MKSKHPKETCWRRRAWPSHPSHWEWLRTPQLWASLKGAWLGRSPGTMSSYCINIRSLRERVPGWKHAKKNYPTWKPRASQDLPTPSYPTELSSFSAPKAAETALPAPESRDQRPPRSRALRQRRPRSSWLRSARRTDLSGFPSPEKVRRPSPSPLAVPSVLQTASFRVPLSGGGLRWPRPKGPEVRPHPFLPATWPRPISVFPSWKKPTVSPWDINNEPRKIGRDLFVRVDFLSHFLKLLS